MTPAARINRDRLRTSLEAGFSTAVCAGRIPLDQP
jgi:hypothetical protein